MIMTRPAWRMPGARSKPACASWSGGDYWAYNHHCIEAKSDARDTGQVYRYLRGPMTGEVLDISYTDASELYGQPPPTWVAGALIEWRLTG